MTDKSKFVLKLSGIDLNNLKAGDVGRLLNKFSKLLGDENIFFESIYSGSAVLEVSTPPEYYNEKRDKLDTNINRQAPALRDIHKVIRHYSPTFPNIDASIFANRTASNDENMELVHHIDYHKPDCSIFKQTETFIGKLEKPAHGKDETDHFTITLANDEVISVSVPKNLSFDLASHLPSLWRFDSLVKFTGIASYELQDDYQMILKSFVANSFEIVENNMTSGSWIDEFVSQGKSGWQDIDNPIDVWLEERHS